MAVRKKSTAKRRKPSQAPATSAPRSRSRKSTSRTSRTSTPKSNGFTVDGLIKELTPVLGVIAGFAVASFLDKKFTTPTATAVAGLAGLEGTDANKFVKPVLVLGTGFAIKRFVKHEFIQHASVGVMAFGGVNLASAVIGKTISLSGIEDEVATKQIAVGNADSDLQKAIDEALKATTAPVKGVEEVAQVAQVASVSGLASDFALETIGELAPETIGELAPETIGAYDDLGDLGDVDGLDENGNPQAW